MTTRPVIGITLGDPAGIGPEVVHKALASGKLSSSATYQVIGDPQSHRRTAAVDWLHEGACRCQRGELAGLVTAPLAKTLLHEAGHRFPGQTELLAHLARRRRFAMMLVGGPLRVALVTTHAALRQVPGLITARRIITVTTLTHEVCRRFGIAAPRVGVAALNPHRGEGGLFGTEEIRIIAPAVKRLARRLPGVSGPWPADTLFHKHYHGEFDAVVCLYHDQGLAPLKMIAFDTGVNLTLGLPFVRTSPDHGTAPDIAGRNLARPDSMIAAINLAVQLVQQPVG
ncbi:4-hydroxythreonine-4-phosphate dehydrogenase PdxA [bacterium]|nr:4-hydroxythreonine-4-phosphate dehydrogenase PdxA [bacterium]